MPNCFNLTKRGETTPSKLGDVDAICQHLGTLKGDMLKVLSFLEAEYTSDAWAEIGRGS